MVGVTRGGTPTAVLLPPQVPDRMACTPEMLLSAFSACSVEATNARRKVTILLTTTFPYRSIRNQRTTVTTTTEGQSFLSKTAFRLPRVCSRTINRCSYHTKCHTTAVYTTLTVYGSEQNCKVFSTVQSSSCWCSTGRCNITTFNCHTQQPEASTSTFSYKYGQASTNRANSVDYGLSSQPKRASFLWTNLW